jgi:hypothetical protein
MKKAFLVLLMASCQTLPIPEATDIIKENEKLSKEIQNDSTIPEESKNRILDALKKTKGLAGILGKKATEDRLKAEKNASAANHWYTFLYVIGTLICSFAIYKHFARSKI